MKINKYLLAIIISFSFFILQEGLMFLYSYLFGTEFIFKSEINLLLIQLLIYLIILAIVVSVVISTKTGINYYSGIKNNRYFISVLFITFLLIIVVNPINRFDQIIGQVEFSNPALNNGAPLTEQLLKLISTVVIVPINEELIFRGGILKMLTLRRKNTVTAILFSSFLFALIHIDPFNLNYNYLLNVFISGIIYGVIYIRFGLLFSIISHSFGNLVWFLGYFYNFKLNFVNYLDFGFLYWLSVSAAFIILSLFIFRSYKKLMEQK